MTIRYFFILFILFAAINSGSSQQLMPLSLNQYKKTGYNPAIQAEINKLKAQQSKFDTSNSLSPETKNLFINNFKSLLNLPIENKGTMSDYLNNLQMSNYTDPLKEYISNYFKNQIEALQKSDTNINKVISGLNQSPDLTISGIGGVSNIQNISQAGGNFAITATFRLGDFHRIGNSNWLDATHMYMAFNTKTGSSEDSQSVTKSFLFPDISKRDFVLGFYWDFLQVDKNWQIAPTVEFSLNRYKTVTSDSVVKDFHSESVLIGFKCSKILQFNIGSDTTYEAGFYLYPYYSIINVQPKNFDAYRDFITPSASSVILPPTVHSIGLQAGLVVSKLQLFANMKYVLTHTDANTPPDFQGFTYTIGTIIGVDILKFKLQ